MVASGSIDTNMATPLPEKTIETVKEHVPLGRLGEVHEVGETVAFLASDAAS